MCMSDKEVRSKMDRKKNIDRSLPRNPGYILGLYETNILHNWLTMYKIDYRYLKAAY